MPTLEPISRNRSPSRSRWWYRCSRSRAETHLALCAPVMCVDGSRQYQGFESYLMPKPTFPLLRAEGPLPLAIETDPERYLEGRRDTLGRERSAVGKLAEAGGLQDVGIVDGDIKITPLRAVTSPEATALKDQAYELLPRIKITDLLQEVDRWTGLSECFTHQRSGRLLMTSPCWPTASISA